MCRAGGAIQLTLQSAAFSAQDDSGGAMRRWVLPGFAVLGLIVLVGILVLVGVHLAKQNITPEAKLPLLTIVGVIALFTSLALVAFGFAAVDLTDRTQALALPEGSIRAAIALCLVVLFAIISVSLYSGLAEGPIRYLAGLTKDQSDAFTRDTVRVQIITTLPVGTADDTTYTVYYRQSPSRASEDFAKQLLVMIGTLVTAVASFYFGTKAGHTAPAPETRGPPVLASVDPNTLALGATTDLELTGSNLLPVTQVSLVQGANKLTATDVMSSDSAISCKVKVPTGTPAGKWDVLVTDASGRTARLGGAVTL
jgi:hypothetical protein